MTFLRESIARIEGGLAPGFDNDRSSRKVTLGRDLALDHMLRGGLSRGGLHEIVAARPGDAGAASGFALALAARFAGAARTPIVWVLEDGARAESGAPYAPGLAAHGIDPERLIVVRTANGPDSLWAIEEALKCRALAAVIADLWRTKTYDLVASRRLVLAAQKSGTPGLLVPAGAAGSAAALSSAARTRFEIRAMRGPFATAAGGVPVPGAAAWGVRLARIRAGPHGAASAFDWTKVWPLVWDHEEARFRDAFSFSPPALPRDRPPAPAAVGRRIA